MIDFNNGNFVKLFPCAAGSVSDIEKILIPGESVLAAFKGIRDYVVFTEHRCITVNVQGITGKKKDYTSLPYKKISTFSVETSGHFDLDCELDMWFSGLGQVHLEFTGSTDITGIAKLIAKATL